MFSLWGMVKGDKAPGDRKTGLKVILLTLITIMGVGASSPAPISILARPSFQVVPGGILITLKIAPNSKNVLYCVGYDGDNQERSSCEGLDGERSRITFDYTYLGIPEGEYEAYGALYQSPGGLVKRVSHPFEVR